MPSNGIINTVFALGERFVLRVPRQHPAHADQARREAIAIPAAAAAGVRTPPLVAFDISLELLPVPYLVVERVAGLDAEALGVVPPPAALAWRALGRDLALLHAAPGPDFPAIERGEDEMTPLLRLFDRRLDDGWLSPLEAAWIGPWVERLEATAGPPGEVAMVHGDLQMSNVLLDRSQRYQALIDWGCTRSGDPALDFRVLPMLAAREALAGYRQEGGFDLDEAQVLLRRLQLLLAVLPRRAAPGLAWREPSVAWLTDLLGLPLHDLGRALAAIASGSPIAGVLGQANDFTVLW